MMFIYNILLVLVLVIQVCGSLRVPPGQYYNDVLIQWATDCDQYDTIAGRLPWVRPIRILPSNVTESECRANCTGDRECGGYVVYPKCRIYNINHQIINNYLNDTPYLNYNQPSDGAFYSKSCQYDTGASDLSCNVYSTSAIIDHIGNLSITYMWTNSPGMTAAQCQSWCTLYTECENAAYTYVTDGSSNHAWCYLHDATVEELEAGGYTSGYTNTTINTNVNYNRQCSDGSAYIPGAPTPSSGIRLVPSVWAATVTVIIMITMPMWKLY